MKKREWKGREEKVNNKEAKEGHSQYSHAKQSTYHAFNAVFGKVGRVASSEVLVQLFKSKCLPVMYYGLEACPVNKSQPKSFQYVVNCCFGKC